MLFWCFSPYLKTLFQTETCPDGTCPVDLSTGKKNCSTSKYVSGKQVCMPPNHCKDPLPYAVLPDGSTAQNPLNTTLFGTCNSAAQECDCASAPSCPSGTAVYYQLSSTTNPPALPQYKLIPQAYSSTTRLVPGRDFCFFASPLSSGCSSWALSSYVNQYYCTAFSSS
ncbi:hypothetical protein Gasu2_34320 [Galdieria sulphuraria]|nr:hypothetical protein Gasu2_34320 [Galdieria sulphuraria]